MRKIFLGTLFFSVLFLTAGFMVTHLLPSEFQQEPTLAASSANNPTVFEAVLAQTESAEEIFALPAVQIQKQEKLVVSGKKGDDGLRLYRQENSRLSVIYFYTRVTENKDVAVAILEAADRENIPLSLAFALAYAESRYNWRAVNKNANNTIDRGLFQLNNRSFPKLSEADFFNPAVSAKYGMSHLRFCLNTAGNEIAALAIYNAGTGNVHGDRTPQITLNYIAKITDYRANLDRLFADEVLSFYDRDITRLIAKN